MKPHELDPLIRVLTILQAVYQERGHPPVVTDSFTAGFRAGAASSYADVIARLRDLKAEQGEAAA